MWVFKSKKVSTQLRKNQIKSFLDIYLKPMAEARKKSLHDATELEKFYITVLNAIHIQVIADTIIFVLKLSDSKYPCAKSAGRSTEFLRIFFER